jgi:hypothetical protein
MLIVSRFHDYYDTASIYGIDKTCVYLRSQEQFKIERPHWYSDYSVRLPSGKSFKLARIGGSRMMFARGVTGEWELGQEIVGFCGQFYPVVLFKPRFGTGKSVGLYSEEEFNSFLVKEEIRRSFNKSYFSPRWDRYNIEHAKGARGFFSQEGLDGYAELFHAFRTPVFSIGNRSLCLNPVLKDFGFMKMKDPQSAFQDVYMFMSGVLGAPPKPKEKMSDKVLAAAKGHDGPYSFRKPPGKRGKNRWR